MKKHMPTMLCLVLTLLIMGSSEPARAGGNVIFVHPDGSSLNHWNAARLRWAGPDGMLNWDRLPGMAVYRSHMKDSLQATSHGGATVHAFGVKVPADSYGMDGDQPCTALSGKQQSIMQEARSAGMAVGIVNSGSLIEPGTGAFLAGVPSRRMHQEIVTQIVESGADVILAGGEEWMLPEGVLGRYGEGRRNDGRNLLAEARDKGYTVVTTRQELKALPDNTTKLLGVFAKGHTFHDKPEEVLALKGLRLYEPHAPTVADMTEAALSVLAALDKPFLLVVEEEGSDNFPNKNHAAGGLEALRRADEALGIAHDFVRQHPNTLLVTAADSDASGLQVVGGYPPRRDPIISRQVLPATTGVGAPLDGRSGTESKPFEARPDASGKTHPFAVCWPTRSDTYGAILVRAAGLHADRVQGNMDNTDIYRLMYYTLFDKVLPSPVGSSFLCWCSEN